MGLFNASAPVLSDASLILQITLICFLVLGFLTARARHKFLRHGILMAAVLALHTISIMLVMVPSMLAMRGLFQNLSSSLALIFLLHATLGGLVEVLGIYLVGVWVLGRTSVKSCFGRKKLMQATMVLWIMSVVIGIYGYILFYPSA